MDYDSFRNEQMGTIYMTDDLEFIKTVPNDLVKIISLDEDGVLDPNLPNVVLGTCLLPPIDAKIAEADGDEELYNMHYTAYMNTPQIQSFICAIIAVLYRKGQLLLYAPQMREGISIPKLMELLLKIYGIGIGIVGVPHSCYYDPRCIPVWLSMLYLNNIISPKEFLVEFPLKAPINEMVISRLIQDLKPVGDSINDKVSTLMNYRARLKNRPNTKMAIFKL